LFGKHSCLQQAGNAASSVKAAQLSGSREDLQGDVVNMQAHACTAYDPTAERVKGFSG
jgi:hypothetical protein